MSSEFDRRDFLRFLFVTGSAAVACNLSGKLKSVEKTSEGADRLMIKPESVVFDTQEIPTSIPEPTDAPTQVATAEPSTYFERYVFRLYTK